MSDPLYRSPEPRQPPADQGFLRAMLRRHLLRIASGGVAFALIAAIWLVWRVG